MEPKTQRIAPASSPVRTSRAYTLGVRLTPSERSEIKKAAKAQGCDEPSAWVRAVTLALISAGMEVELGDK